MYYSLIMLTVVMFGFCFYLNDEYRARCGSSIKVTFQYSLLAGIPGLIVITAINGFKFEFTMFAFLMALIQSVSGLAFTFCSFKALDKINLSLYSVFSMLGGMALPAVVGILFFSEAVTVGKIICFVLITAALLLTTDKGKSKGGEIYYAGVFILNGMSGVISKIFTAAPFEKTSAGGFSILAALCSLTISIVALIIISSKDKTKISVTPIAAGIGALSGILNRIANFILVIALSHVDASVQYPMVTGGVMIVSTALSYVKRNKPSNKELLSVAVAFIGMLALFFN